MSSKGKKDDLLQAVKTADKTKLKKLLKSKPTKEYFLAKDEENFTPMLLAIKQDDVEIVKDFLDYYQQNPKKDLDINETDPDGFTLLHNAVSIATDRTLIPLLNFAGIQVDVENKDQNTPLHYFCQYFFSPNVQEPFELMIKKGARLDAQNSNGETPLHKAIFNQSVRLLIVDLLLKAGANVNIQTHRGYTALLYAVRMKREDLVSVLLKNEADVTIPEKNGVKPLDLAIELKLSGIQKRLENVVELYNWLEELGLKEEAPKFVKEELYKDVLPDLNDSLLEKIGISAGHRIKILKACNELKVEVKPKIKTPKMQSLVTLAQDNDNSRDIELSKLQSIPKEFIIHHQDLEFTQRLATGGNAKVYRGLYQGRTDVAIKVLKEIAETKLVEEFEKEVAIMSTIRGKELVHFYGVCFKPKMCMVMEFCQRGSLYNVMMDETVDFGWDKLLKFAFQICRGIDTLHSCDPPVVHRDIKSLNFLVTENWDIKVADFGLSRFLQQDNMKTLHQIRGTPVYVAPELTQGQNQSDLSEGGFTPKSDVYGIGMVIWEMVRRCLCGVYQRPFSEYPELVFDFSIVIAAASGKRPTMPDNSPSALARLIEDCWASDPHVRPDCKQILKILLDIDADYKSNQEEWNQKRKLNLASVPSGLSGKSEDKLSSSEKTDS